MALPFEFTDSFPTGADDFVGVVPTGIRGAEELIRELAKALQFPGWFGFNWDALNDSLCDFHWTKRRRIVLTHQELPALPDEELRIYLEILASAVACWEGDDHHQLVVTFPVGARRAVRELMHA